MLIGALSAIDIAVNTVPDFVSNCIFFFFQLRANSVVEGDVISMYGFAIAEATIFGCCDFIAQCILVRTANKYSIHLIHLIFKDTPLLDCVRSKYPRHNRSFNLSMCIFRSVILS